MNKSPWHRTSVCLVSLSILLPLAARAVPASAAAGVFVDSDSDTFALDIDTVSHVSDATTVTLTVGTVAPFVDSIAHFSWVIDKNSEGLPEYAVGANWNGSAIVSSVVNATTNARVATATVSRPTSSSISVSFPRSAIGNPPAYVYVVSSWSDTNGDGVAQDDEIDIAPSPGGPSVLADGHPFYRIAGSDRITTSVAASTDLFGDGTAGTVVLARSDAFPDALSGAPLAVAKDGPLMLTATATLDPRVEAEIKRVLPSGKTVYLLGGTSALSDAIATRLTTLGYTTVRLSGADRYATALAVADQGLGNPSVLFLTTGLGFADALTAGAAAAAKSGAVLLTAGSALPDAVSAYISAHSSATRYAVGGPAAAADPTATPVVGSDRYLTGSKVAQMFFTNPTNVGIASGTNYPDALSGGVNVGHTGGPLLLSDPTSLTPTVLDYLTANKASLQFGSVYGGTAAFSETVRVAAESAIN